MELANRKRAILSTIILGLVSGFLVSSLPLSDIQQDIFNQDSQNSSDLKSNNSNVQVTKNNNSEKSDKSEKAVLEEGFYGSEEEITWMKEEGTISVHSEGGDRIFRLNITMSNGNRPLTIKKDGKILLTKSVSPDKLIRERASGKETLISVNLQKGKNTIKIISENGCEKPPNPEDERCLSIAIGESEFLYTES